ncbi:MAG: hypothetical protein NPIRA02_33320 [Nitrospirales bacterium]|nr:MAG: hypothetical protein NPIRA02_33320 [Nitrospirales bacterium]
MKPMSKRQDRNDKFPRSRILRPSGDRILSSSFIICLEIDVFYKTRFDRVYKMHNKYELEQASDHHSPIHHTLDMG